MLHFNLGISTSQYPTHVSTIIGETLPWTLALVGVATVLSFVIGTLLGIFAAWRRGGWLDRALPALTLLQATPYFFLALLLIQLFAVELNWLPYGQGYSLGSHPRLQLDIHLERDHALDPARADDHRHFDRRLDAADAQRDADHDLRGLHPRRAGQGTLDPARDVHLRRPQRDPAEHRRLRARNRVRRCRRAGDGDRLLLSGVGFTLYNAVTSNDYPLMQGIFLVISLAVLSAAFLADIVYAIA